MDLPEFLDKYGSDATSNFDLLRWSKQLGIPNFKVLMRNELCKLKKTKKNYVICNYQTTSQKGIHWVALFRKDNEENYYFDSYGLQPFKEAIDFLGPHYIYSTFKIQKPIQKCCGQLSLYCLKNGKNYYDTVLDMKLVS